MAVSVEPSRSRRSLLRAGLAGLTGLALGALGRPSRTSAAAGGSLVMGASNDAGTSNTTLTTSSTGTALQVTQNSTGTALRGAAGNGIAGFFTSANGSGVSGVVANSLKFGIYGANDAATNSGTGAAIRANGKQNHGVVATSAHQYAAAVWAANSAHTGDPWQAGVAVQAFSDGVSVVDWAPLYKPAAGEFAGSNGIKGAACTGSEDGVGVGGITDGLYGHGVLGYATSATGEAVGVYGASQAPSGMGVAGYTTSTGVGVYAHSTGSGNALETYGPSHFTGNLDVTGSLSKGSGSFKIDHPLDPANKYLYHSFVESPDMLNVYSGTATLDKDGEATVALPDWFEALNRDVRYQLTPIGPAEKPLYVRAELKDGRFSIGGGRAGQLVCWQLTGIRKDAYAEAHRIEVEVDKPARERGLYLYPKEHGRPEDSGIGVRLHRREPRALPGSEKRRDASGG